MSPRPEKLTSVVESSSLAKILNFSKARRVREIVNEKGAMCNRMVWGILVPLRQYKLVTTETQVL
jgi:hypothetical protein